MVRTTKNNIKKKDEPKPVHTCGNCGGVNIITTIQIWIWTGTQFV